MSPRRFLNASMGYLLLIISVLLRAGDAFAPSLRRREHIYFAREIFSRSFSAPPSTKKETHNYYKAIQRLGSRLSMANIDFQSPSPEEAADMGIRDWPQQFKTDNWSEFVAEDATVIRYILSGTGSVEITDEDLAFTRSKEVGPGSLLQVTGPATVKWTVNDELIVLTPGFEQGGLLAGVAAAVIVLFGALIAGTTGGL